MKIQFTHNFVLFATHEGRAKQYHIEQGEEMFQVSEFINVGPNIVSFTFADSCRLSGSAINIEKSYVKLIQSGGPSSGAGCCK